MVAAGFEHFVLEGGDEGGLAPAELRQTVLGLGVEVEEFGQGDVLGHALGLPFLQAVVAELFLVQRRIGNYFIGVAQLADVGGHVLAGGWAVDSIGCEFRFFFCVHPVIFG